jgi:hypothetical protein
MSAKAKLGEEDIAWVKAYAKEVPDAFEGIFNGAKDRFKDDPRLIERFKAAIDKVLKNGRGKFRAVDEAHNELCIAAAILQSPNPQFTVLEYEPSLAGCAKTIDFRAKTGDGVTVFIDVKTIKPVPKDRWGQFEKALKEDWLPDNVKLMFSKEWLGGELWHNTFAARSRMLEYTLELEQKIADCKLQADKTFFVLMLCGEGFYWGEDELEDFVSFYFTGSHRSDDPFAKVETKYIDERQLKLARTISRFACMRRRQGDVHKRLNWNVQPPRDPSYE